MFFVDALWSWSSNGLEDQVCLSFFFELTAPEYQFVFFFLTHITKSSDLTNLKEYWEESNTVNYDFAFNYCNKIEFLVVLITKDHY